MPRGLTVLAPIRAGEEEALRRVLRAIGDDIGGKTAADGRARPHIAFTRSRTIHFARFAILRDPDRGADAARLLFSSNYDGTLEAHLAELIGITTDMDAIWGRCEGYSGPAAFASFVRARAHDPAAFYIAYRDETVDSIRHAGAIRRELRSTIETEAGSAITALLNRDKGLASWRRRLGHRVRATVDRLVRAAPITLDVVRAIRRHGFATVFHATNRIIASLNRYPVFRLANVVTRNRMPPRRSVYSSVAVDNCAEWTPFAERDEIPSALPTPPTFREDVVTQNQLTLVTVVDPRHVERVKAVMSAIDSYARRLSPPGSLIGISTIHFVRWLLIDRDRRLVMLSDYDNSWENYIDEFAEMILSGLDAIWETSFGFPPDGARDLNAFKRFLRAHQVPAEAFYSAYPERTVLNVAADLRLARALQGGERLDALLPVL